MKATDLTPPDGFERALGQLGFTDEERGGADTPERWLLSKTISGAQASNLPADAIEVLRAAWPKSFTADLRSDNQPVVNLLQPGEDDKRQELGQNGSYRLYLKLDKKLLLGERFDRVTMIVDPVALDAKGRGTYSAIEKEWFRSAEPVVVAVPDVGVRLIGVSMIVASFDELTDDDIDPADHAAGGAWLPNDALVSQQEELNSAGDFAGITPDRLAVDGIGWNSCAGRIVARLTAHAFILFTADRVRFAAASAIDARYASTNGDIALTVDASAVPGDPQATASAAQSFLSWVYDSEPVDTDRDWTAERLDFARVAIAEHLHKVDDERRVRLLIDGVDDVRRSAVWHWRTFIENKIRSHTGAVADFRRQVSTTSLDFADRTAAIASGVADAAKAAIGVLLTSFIGAALSSSFNDTVFKIGLYSYTVYVLLFSGVFGIGGAVLRYRTAAASYRSDRSRATDLLGECDVEALERSTLNKNRTLFYLAAIVAALLYICAAVAAIIAAGAVPDLLDDNDPTLLGQAAVVLTAEDRTTELMTERLDGSTTIRFELQPDSVTESANVTVTAEAGTTRDSVCGLIGVQSGDGALLDDPIEPDRYYLIHAVENDDEMISLNVIDLRGNDSLTRDNAVAGCELLGVEGADWTLPDWDQ